MARKKYEYLGGRTVTVTCLGTMSNEEATDILAELIAKAYHDREEKESENKWKIIKKNTEEQKQN